jgi:iron complex transport system substrate-binding protein
MHVVRAFALGLAALALAAGARASRDFVDDAGRRIALPERIERVYAAGPPASVLVFALAPDKLIGWTRAFRDDEAQWVPRKYAALPELGRLTGRGNTANVEVVLKEKPDVIIDVGSTSATFASLADRVQSQTGIPYVLLDGHLETTPRQLEKIASILGAEARGRELSGYAARILDGLREKIAAIPAAKRPDVYYARGPQGLVTSARRTWRAASAAGSRTWASSRSCCGIRRSSSPTTRISTATCGSCRCGMR